jgi:glycine/D-amino acid oxidase-like deaminating enzyme
MLDAARRHGAQVRTGAQVARVEMAGGRATGVVLASGERCPADVVVNCAGRWADTLSVGDEPDLRLPLAPTFGLLVFTPPVATCVRRIVRSAHVHLRPDGAGRLVLHMDDADATLTSTTQPSPQLPIAHDLVQRVAAVLPSIGPVDPEAVRIGVRPIPTDGLSAVGPLPGLSGYYVVVTHSGVTLSPILAHLAASELMSGTPEHQLEPFRPARLLAPSRV